MLRGHRALATVGVEHGEAKGRLAEPRQDDLRLARALALPRVPRPLRGLTPGGRALEARLPEAHPLR